MREEIDPLAVLKSYVGRFPTLRKAAESLGISAPYLTDILQGNRQVTGRVLESLGLERVSTIRLKRKPVKERSHETV